ncbi:type IV pilus biogenesis factor PilY1 [Marinobacter sp. JH2]|nr:PilC/PilY family type IV pilus protein [Marinobacter sp. JH2]QBM18061.1 type IV pilus biogenesis factor PilY1 [Marinobacter sp. JH2]
MKNFRQIIERTLRQVYALFCRKRAEDAGMVNARRMVVAIFLAILPMFSVQAAVDSVDVDQSPLIVSDPLPPNIVLMLDDSGSMAFDYMPNLSGNWSSTSWRAPSVNRVYYDPSVTYLAPFKADGGRYPAITTFPDAPLNGYDNSSESKFIPAWRSPFKSFYFGKFGGESCPSGTTQSGWNNDYCYSSSERNDLAHLFYTTRRVNGTTYYYYEKSRFGAFAYTKQNGNEVLVSDRCSEKPNSMSGVCVDADDTSGTAAPSGVEAGENIANWFAYYRTRVFASKAGVMNAFVTLDPAFRVGFGSINGGTYGSNDNDDYLTNPVYGDSYAYISKVKPFGDTSAPGSRSGLYSWLAELRANSSFYNGSSFGGTPLRRALVSVGEYFKNENQPWEVGYDDQGTYDSSQYSCRQSFSILMSDGYWNGNSPSVGNQDSGEAKPFNGSGQSNSLADVALKYWKADLRSNLKDDVPVTSRDSANWQHMSTFTIGLGVEPVLADSAGGSLADIFNWARTGNVGSIDKSKFDWGSDEIADLAHAAVNGRGDFFSARNPQQFADGLKKALADIAAAPGAGGSPTFSGGETLTSNTKQFSSSYMTGSWTGDLKAVSYDSTTDTFSVDAWRASEQLPVAADRNIWTIDSAGDPVEFKASELSGYLDILGDNLYSSDPKGAAWGSHIVNYLRGDQSYEGSAVQPLTIALRKRDTVLGDIVNSTPVLIGDPKPNLYKHVLDETYFDGLSGTDDYKTFVTDNSGRTPVAYVAANDGMLHAFDAETGNEIFAYIPGAVVGGTGDASLARIANPEYGVYNPVDGTQPIPHQFYNDGKLTTQNVYIDGAWKTILVGTTGRGTSRTVYALDITNPADLSDPQKADDAILWERSAGDGKSNDEWIGMALGRPTISLIAESTQGKKGTGKWVAHLGNGPNSENGKAALLQFDLKTGDLKVYAAGTAGNNGLSAPYVIQNNDTDGVSEYAFAGDLQGNVWRFELSANGGSVSQPIYIAKDSDGNRQPITADMYATQNPDTGAIWVFFGTGRYLTKSDILENSPKVQTWYGLRALAGPSGFSEAKASDTRNNLQEREIIAEKNTTGGVYRVTSDGEFSDLTTDGDAGWYMDLESPANGKEGERIVYQTQLIAGRLVVNTLIPKSSSPCDTSPAGATLIVDPFSGANPEEPVLDADGDGSIDSKDTVTIGGKLYHYNGERYKVGMAGVFSALKTSSGNVRLFGSALDSSDVSMETTMGASGSQRLNWHEIIN